MPRESGEHAQDDSQRQIVDRPLDFLRAATPPLPESPEHRARLGSGGALGTQGTVLTPRPPTSSSTRSRGARCRAWRRSIFAQQLKFYLYRAPRFLPLLHTLFNKLFISDLLRLHDILSATDLEGRYWLWSGLVLGWAREGRVLPHDDMDADFAVLSTDWRLLEAAVPVLERQGFLGVRRFVNHSGLVTELTFMRHGARFEFFRLSESDEMATYTVYGRHGDVHLEIEHKLPLQPTEEFRFLGRTWRKVLDHERELEYLYGDWRTPDRHWSYMAPAPSEIARRPWDPTTSTW